MCVLVGVMLPPFAARYVCVGGCGVTPLSWPLGMCWMMWCHPLVLPALYVLLCVVPSPCVPARHLPVGVVLPPSVARYVCAG